ncbi:MAG: hypothetical protein HQK67_10685 [Desulfamplus sp.]|nr:hypothetical protein [Desulfamplus sp.]
MGKAEALREIKIQMLKNTAQNNWSNPFYWSPLVVFGDGQ